MKITEAIQPDHGSQIVQFLVSKIGIYHIIWVSDLHSDSKHSSFKFFEQVAKKYPKAFIIIGGDHLDVMQNFMDPRSSKSALDPEFAHDDYLNRILDFNVSRWSKYAHRILAFFIGNHELTQIRRHGMDVTKEMVKRLNAEHKTNILLGDLEGWLKLRFSVHKRNYTKNIFYQHIPESGGKRSKGMLSVDIIKGKWPDADIYVSEHIHNTWIKPESVEQLKDNGQVGFKNKWVVQMPTLKNEHEGPRRGYVHLRNYGKVPIGVVVFEIDITKEAVKMAPRYELID